MLSDRRPSSSTTSTRTRLTPHVGIPAHPPDSNITSHLLCSHCTASGQHYARLVKFRGRAFSIGVLLCLNSPPAAKKTQVGCVAREGAGKVSRKYSAKL